MPLERRDRSFVFSPFPLLERFRTGSKEAWMKYRTSEDGKGSL